MYIYIYIYIYIYPVNYVQYRVVSAFDLLCWELYYIVCPPKHNYINILC